MHRMKILPIVIVTAGIILLAGAAATYVAKSVSTTVCEACGMEIPKDDASTMVIVSNSNRDTHYACCPVCAMEVAIYYENTTLKAHCFSCDENITITCKMGNITSVSPSGDAYNITMLFGMSCPKNKFICSDECANATRTGYDWASSLPTKTVPQTYTIALSKLSQTTVGYRPIQAPTVMIGLLAGGTALLAVAPIEWFFVEKRKQKAQ